MNYTKHEILVPSSDNIHTLSGVAYVPNGEIRGIYHVVHGMTEYIARYESFMTELAENGYIACGYDNLGHGHTANEGELGYIAKKNGYDLLCRDVAVFAENIRARYPDLPYYLMGHSMGSFIARIAAQKYVSPDKLIIMGTGGKNRAADLGIAVASVISFFCGGKHVSRALDKMAFGSYNKRFSGDEHKSSASWLSSDESVREKFRGDKYCNFKFTVSAMKDLIKLNKYANSKAWYNGISKSMPILLVSGTDDPVGNYSKGILEIKIKLDRVHADSYVKLYGGARHEILNDKCRDEVVKDILEFISDAT